MFMLSLVWNAFRVFGHAIDARRFDSFSCNKLKPNQYSKACARNSNFVTVTIFQMLLLLLLPLPLPLLLRMSMKFVTHKRHRCAYNIINDTFMVCFPLLHSLSRSVHTFGHLSIVCAEWAAL